MKTKLTLTIIVALVVLAMAAAPASAQQNNCGMLEFSLDPSSGPAGSVVTVSGSEAYSNDTLGILWEPVYSSDETPVGSASSDGSGNFTGQFTVPAGASPGTYNVVIDGYDSEDQSVFCETTFTVTGSSNTEATPDQPAATGTETPVTQQVTGSTGTTATTTSTGSLPSTGLPLLPVAGLALGGLGLTAMGWRRR